MIRRLKEHIKATEQKKGFISSRDIYYFETYIMDFLLIKREKAREFLNSKVIKELKAVTNKRSLKRWNVLLMD